MKFFNADDGSFDVQTFKHACDVVITAQEMLVDNCSYPTPAIAANSHKFRPLGLGYANLGALLMAAGVPYDSDEGRAHAAAITSLMCGEAYLQSSKIAAELGPFAGYAPNRDAFLEVIGMHRDAADAGPRQGRSGRAPQGAEGGVGRGARDRQAARLQERPGHGARADRHDRLHDGLRHDRRRAGPRARQVQEARRRRDDQDRQPDRAAGAEAPGLLDRLDQRDRGLRRREGHDRGRAELPAGAPAGVRLRVPRAERHPLDPLHGPRQDDGGDAAVPLRRDQQDRQPAAGRDARGDRGRLHGRLEAGPEGHRDLPRRLQAHAAAEHGRVEERHQVPGRPRHARVRRQGRGRRSRRRSAASSPTSAARSPTSSRSRATRAT